MIFGPPGSEILATDLQPTDPVFTLTSLQSGSRSCTFSFSKDYLMIFIDVADGVNGEIQKRFNKGNL